LDEVVTNQINQITPFLSRLPKSEIITTIKEHLDLNEKQFGKNNWKCVLQNALIDNDAFMNLFTYAIAEQVEK
jgi:hypothetical protein